MIDFCHHARVPQWNTDVDIRLSHQGSRSDLAAEELAFTLARRFCVRRSYVIDAGLDIDTFVPRLSFFFNSHIDFFEEIAKFRAARRIWAVGHEANATGPRIRTIADMLRFHTQTAGVSLTAQQPENNIVRTAVEALAAVLGGTQSLHTNALDETLALPTEESAMIALRTQQIIAHESGVTNTVDPLGGSYFVEDRTQAMVDGCYDYFDRIDDFGGMVEAIEAGYPQREIVEAAYQFQKAFDAKKKLMVGVNGFVVENEEEIETLYISDEVAKAQIESLEGHRGSRDAGAVARTLDALKVGAEGDANTMELILDCVKAYASVGEISDALRDVYGTYEEPAVF